MLIKLGANPKIEEYRLIEICGTVNSCKSLIASNISQALKCPVLTFPKLDITNPVELAFFKDIMANGKDYEKEPEYWMDLYSIFQRKYDQYISFLLTNNHLIVLNYHASNNLYRNSLGLKIKEKSKSINYYIVSPEIETINNVPVSLSENFKDKLRLHLLDKIKVIQNIDLSSKYFINHREDPKSFIGRVSEKILDDLEGRRGVTVNNRDYKVLSESVIGYKT